MVGAHGSVVQQEDGVIMASKKRVTAESAEGLSDRDRHIECCGLLLQALVVNDYRTARRVLVVLGDCIDHIAKDGK
jgi:hypothetical protein